MPDVFDAFAPTVPDFLTRLAANNTKDWFAAHKDEYDRDLKAPALTFGSEVAQGLRQMTGLLHSCKLFRVHRDVRFSKDKTPYNAHLHLSFTPDSGDQTPPMWFWGLGQERLSLGCGVFGFGKAELDRFRDRAAGGEGAALAKMLSRMQNVGLRVSEPELKRVPPGYDKDHPHGDLLRRKGLSVWVDFDDRDIVARPGHVAFCLEQFQRLRPVFDTLID